MDYEVLTRAIARLSELATEDVPPRVTLAELCTVAAGALRVDSAGVMLTDAENNRYVHGTTATAQTLERIQESLRTGPCRDAARTGLTVTAVGGTQIARWEGFADVAARTGTGAVAAIPLMSRGRCWGVLDLYRLDTHPWEDGELAAATLLANVATSHVVTAHDRDVARLAQAQLAHVSSHDHLTGLSNRVLLMDRIGHALESAPRRGCAVGVIFADLNRFKAVNDTYGHRVGDAVLRETALRLNSVLRGNDTVGRMSGDEFVIVCEELPVGQPNQPQQALNAIAGRIEQAMKPRIDLEVGEVSVSVSLGAAVATGKMTAENLLHEADIAMYQAKQRTRPRGLTVRDYTAGQSLGQARTFERRLTGALQRHEFEVHYQPIVRALEPERVAAVEALLRWRDADGELIPAGAFIDIASDHGLMPAVGGWVIEQVCEQMALWCRDLGDRAPEVVFVNVGAREINDPSLPGTLASACRRHGVASARVGLEIVEDSFAHPGLAARLAGIREAGHPLSIDDFGTGYSSLSRLLELRVDAAKIDRAFVSGVSADRHRVAFADAVVSIAGSLGIDVIAEGVETVGQQELLTQAGCTYLQGYLFGRPAPAEELTAVLRKSAQVESA